MCAERNVNFHAAGSAGWFAASRRLYDGLVRLSSISSVDDGLSLMADSHLLVLAYEQGLLAVRWYLANTDAREASAPFESEELDAEWGRASAPSVLRPGPTSTAGFQRPIQALS
jgi:hypothetical protein